MYMYAFSRCFYSKFKVHISIVLVLVFPGNQTRDFGAIVGVE